MHIIDLTTWKRREHYRYFCSLADPYWSITTALDCSKTYWNSKHKGQSFFLSYLHRSLQALNQVEELRMRIDGEKILCYDRVHASTTVMRPDETFGCCFIEFIDDFAEFAGVASAEVEKVMATTGMCLENDYRADQVYYSSIPWHRFSGLTFAKALNSSDSVPRITFGRTYEDEGKLLLPVAVQVHHGLVDGLHVARFLEAFQQRLSDQSA